MSKVFVLDKRGNALMPTHPARARRLLREGRAVVHRRLPFTITLKNRMTGFLQPVRLKLDPGSRTTGIAVVREAGEQAEVLHLAELIHKQGVRAAMLKRSNYRRRRRVANLRYREPRFSNRARAEGWLPPSLMSRVHQTTSWVERYRRLLPVGAISVESVKFDTRKMRDPEVSGVEYQVGELSGYEVKEYLLEKWGRRCAYCGRGDVPLEVEHLVPRSRGGTDQVSNLALACRKCNRNKGNRTAEEFGHASVQARARCSLRDATALNAARWSLYRRLAAMGLPVETGTGGRTKYNRACLGLPKSHAFDALCVGASTPRRLVGAERATKLLIKAAGRGRYQRTLVNSCGFPRAHLMRRKHVAGIRTGDLVRVIIARGERADMHEGTVVVRRSGYFSVKRGGRLILQGVSAKRCELLQRFDGYTYDLQ